VTPALRSTLLTAFLHAESIIQLHAFDAGFEDEQAIIFNSVQIIAVIFMKNIITLPKTDLHKQINEQHRTSKDRHYIPAKQCNKTHAVLFSVDTVRRKFQTLDI
jgi:hypothetical protein